MPSYRHKFSTKCSKWGGGATAFWTFKKKTAWLVKRGIPYLLQEDTFLDGFFIVLIHPGKIREVIISNLWFMTFTGRKNWHARVNLVMLDLIHLSYMTPSTPNLFKCWTVARSFWSSVQAKMIWKCDTLDLFLLFRLYFSHLTAFPD